MSDDQRDSRTINPTHVQITHDSLELSLYDLKNISSAVERAQSAKVHFEGALRVGGFRVHVRWKRGVEQRDSDELVITKITRA